MPVNVAKIEDVVQNYKYRQDDTPPESEPVFFREELDNDCRTLDTAVYDIVTAMLKGKKIPSKNRYKNLK
jgi:hypothetical protein